jgi:signal transduction histidine kinase
MECFFSPAVVGNEAAFGLDYHASGSRKETVLSCLKYGQPALTDRLRLVQEKERIAYGVVLMHPGYQLSSMNDTWPLDLASIVVRIPDLLARATENQNEGSSVYLYQHVSDEVDTYLGSIKVSPRRNTTAKLTPLTEIPADSVIGGTKFSYTEDIKVANKVWRAIVLSDDETFKPDYLFVVIGGSLMFIATCFLAMWVNWNARNVLQMNKERAEADAEQARLILDNAQQAAKAERELNDFIAHEVRNPVAAAMTAVQVSSCTTCVFTDVSVISTYLHHSSPSLLSIKKLRSPIRRKLQHVEMTLTSSKMH